MTKMRHDQTINHGITIALGIVVIVILTLFLVHDEPDNTHLAVDLRNHKRDTIECQASGGFLGTAGYNRQESIYSVCHDVDSLIVLNGEREKYRVE